MARVRGTGTGSTVARMSVIGSRVPETVGPPGVRRDRRRAEAETQGERAARPFNSTSYGRWS